MQCPQCKAEISSTEAEGLQDLIAPLMDLKSNIEKMAMKVALSQGLDKDERLQGNTDTASVLAFAMQ